MPASADLRIGTELADYRLEAVIGHGGMGVVYRAHDPRLKRDVALKLLAPELAADGAFRERFLRESELAAALEHPNVVPIHDVGEVDGLNGKVFLVEPATGKKLRELSPGHLNGLTDLAFHPDGKHLASCGRDTLVRIWDTASGKLVKELGKGRGGQFKNWIHSVSFSADGRWLAAADMVGAVQVWSFGV